MNPRALLVGETGLEPATSAMSKQCSNQLSYPPGRAHYTIAPMGCPAGTRGAARWICLRLQRRYTGIGNLDQRALNAEKTALIWA